MTFKERLSRTVPTIAARLGAKASVSISNPIQYRRGPMSCPDPDVFVWGPLYVATGTSDIGQYNPCRTGRWDRRPPPSRSTGLATSRRGTSPTTCSRMDTGRPARIRPRAVWKFSGRYWAPEVHSIGGQYVAYFGAQKTNGKMGIFVAWTKHLFGGNLQSKILVDTDGSIDPSVWWIGSQLYMVYTHQPNSVWLTKLSADGLAAQGNGVQISEGSLAWEKDTNGHDVEEGPVLWTYKNANGKWTTYCFFNAASTWDPTYAIGVLIQQPDGSWKKQPEPILSAGPELVSTGLRTQPFRTASGKLFISFHCQLRQSCAHHMEERWLCFAPLEMASGIPTVHGGVPPTTVVT